MKTQSHSSQLSHLLRARVSSSITDDAIFTFLSDLDTPRSLMVWLLYDSKEHDQLVSLSINPLSYSSAERFRLDYVATLFLAKSDFLGTTVSKEKAAMEKFHKYEKQCKGTNDVLRRCLPLSAVTTDESAWLRNAIGRKVGMILGDFTPGEFVDSCNWGPGVSTLLKGSHVSAANKFQSETGITRDLYAFVRPWFAEAFPLCALHLWSKEADQNDGFTFELGNVIVTVPKDSKTDRVIAVEPGWNLWFQKGIGQMIRSRLKRFGVDLDNQSKNQQFSHEAAFDGHLATIDFSSASDSISYETVRELVPPVWFTLMDVTRSKIGISGKDVIRWEKFSSMGNGFTFELESLLFFATALAVCEYLEIPVHDVSVYGDDVIIPVAATVLFSKVCCSYGFTVNDRKSFSSGPFRESCGSHYFEATDCKPVYLKSKLNSIQSVYKFINAVRRLSHRFGSNRTCDRRFLRTWRYLYKVIPKPLRLGIPLGFGDGGVVMNFDEALPSLKRTDRHPTWEGFSIRMVVDVGVSQPFDEPGLLMDRVRGSAGLGYGNFYTLRGQVKTRVSHVFIPSWYNLGGWV